MMKIDPFGDLIITKTKRMALRKPKLKKYPKKPKSSNLVSMQNYFARVKEIDAHNSRLVSEYKSKKTKLATLKKKLTSNTATSKRSKLQQTLRSL